MLIDTEVALAFVQVKKELDAELANDASCFNPRVPELFGRLLGISTALAKDIEMQAKAPNLEGLDIAILTGECHHEE